MQVGDYMVRDVTTLGEQAHLLEAVLLVRRSGIRHLPIVDAEGKPVGILTDRDIARVTPSMLAPMPVEKYNELFETTDVTRAMSKDPIKVPPDMPIRQAVKLLHKEKIGALLVVDEKGALIGLLTVTDMLGLLQVLLEEHDKRGS